MSGKFNLALAVIAFQKGNTEDCLSYMAKAGEFGDDLTQFVGEVIKPMPSATRNRPATPQSENTIAPSLAAVGSSDFVSLSNRISRQLALAGHVDEGDEIVEDMPEESVASDDVILDNGVPGIDEEEEATASSSNQGVGPIRYKC